MSAAVPPVGEDRANRYISEASFWTPEFIVESGWTEHVPFAFWLIDQLRPARIVELGTHTGMSYFAMCQAIVTRGLDSRAYAVDTWEGDTHAGAYEDDVYNAVKAVNDEKYAAFSTLLRMTFDDALAEVPDGSVDLLHVDGRHFEEDARHDFESWIPKLSNRAVVLFHDIEVWERDFGVYRVWAEIQEKYPLTFGFAHGNGLGVLGYGPEQTEVMQAFFDGCADPQFAENVRTAYSRLGSLLTADEVVHQLELSRQHSANLEEREEILRSNIADLREAEDILRRHASDLQAELGRIKATKWWRTRERAAGLAHRK